MNPLFIQHYSLSTVQEKVNSQFPGTPSFLTSSIAERDMQGENDKVRQHRRPETIRKWLNRVVLKREPSPASTPRAPLTMPTRDWGQWGQYVIRLKPTMVTATEALGIDLNGYRIATGRLEARLQCPAVIQVSDRTDTKRYYRRP